MVIVARTFAVALLTLAAPLTLVRVLGLDRGFPVVPLMTVFPYAVLLGAAATAVAAVTGLRLELWIGGATVLVGLALLASRVIPGPQPSVAPDGPELTVAVSNLRVGQGDAQQVVEAVDAEGVDVLVVLELTSDAVDRLETAGLRDRLPNAAELPSRSTSGGAIYSRVPLRERPPSTGRGFGRTPRVTLTVDEVEVELDAVHPLPPVNEEWTDLWRAVLTTLPTPSGADAAGTVRILAGDFNASHDHRAFRALLEDGWVDAAASVGGGLRPTFSAIRYGRPVPPVTIDHVLVERSVAVEAVTVRPLGRSDHRILIAHLRLPRR